MTYVIRGVIVRTYSSVQRRTEHDIKMTNGDSLISEVANLIKKKTPTHLYKSNICLSVFLSVTNLAIIISRLAEENGLKFFWDIVG